jgi:signal peptidase I
MELMHLGQAENLVGRAEFIFFSHDPSAAGWLEPWKWPQAIRFNRFFMAIH